jgi:hypothetical protein
MVTVRSAKNKGNQFEYSCLDSLRQALPNTMITKQLGFVQQYDLIDEASNQVFECKRLRGISWNQLVKFWNKLNEVGPKDYKYWVLFQSNNQPCLVFGINEVGDLCIRNFETVFGVPFIKHVGVKRK